MPPEAARAPDFADATKGLAAFVPSPSEAATDPRSWRIAPASSAGIIRIAALEKPPK